ncbi:hypothetical protein L419_00276 [Klebsiella pneumoniae UCICRE 8]|nr:hypothetical protein L419_00276 [Klebsiella pneumoniae UCICRE 8]
MRWSDATRHHFRGFQHNVIVGLKPAPNLNLVLNQHPRPHQIIHSLLRRGFSNAIFPRDYFHIRMNWLRVVPPLFIRLEGVEVGVDYFHVRAERNFSSIVGNQHFQALNLGIMAIKSAVLFVWLISFYCLGHVVLPVGSSVVVHCVSECVSPGSGTCSGSSSEPASPNDQILRVKLHMFHRLVTVSQSSLLCVRYAGAPLRSWN